MTPDVKGFALAPAVARLRPRAALRRFPPAVGDGLAAVSAVALFGKGRERDDAREALREVARLTGETLGVVRQIRKAEQERAHAASVARRASGKAGAS